MLQIIERLSPSPDQLSLGLVLGSGRRAALHEADLLSKRGQRLVGLEAVIQKQSHGPGNVHHCLRLQATQNSC